MKTFIATLLFTMSGMASAITCGPVQPDGTIGPPTTNVGVVPEYCADWVTGDAGQECVVNLGYDFGLKVDEPAIPGETVTGACDGQGSCDLAPEFDNTIVISQNTGVYIDFSAFPFALGAVVMKGGPDANVFFYDPAQPEDSRLYPPLNANGSGEPVTLSHVSFCWGDRNSETCYDEETAWAVGEPYTNRGSWAMYVDLGTCPSLIEPCTFDLRADGGDGVGIDVGTATTLFDPLTGNVTIAINLTGGAIFYYDLADMAADENLKVQPYDIAPSGNPKIGRFAHKLSVPVGDTEASIVVPLAQYYGIHLDVAVPVACE